jgi:hypothetical protein
MTIRYVIKVGIGYQKPCVPDTTFAIGHRRNLGYPRILVDSQSMEFDENDVSQVNRSWPRTRLIPRLFASKAGLPTHFGSIFQPFVGWQCCFRQIPEDLADYSANIGLID